METPPSPLKPTATFEPHVPAHAQMKELTLKAIFFGILFAVIFGTCSVYLALRAGFTMGGSITIAVLSVGLLKKIGKTTILENNIIQTIGSAGESVAAGLIFRTAGFLFLAEGARYFNYWQLVTIAILGGVFGILFMMPLRKTLIIKEHATLPYPEGTACADVLIAGEKQGPALKPILWGSLLGVGYWLCMRLFGLWKEVPHLLKQTVKQFYPNATLGIHVAPEYLGLGYIIGLRTTSHMMLGAMVSWLVLIPLFSAFPQIPLSLGAHDVYTTLTTLGIKIKLAPGEVFPTAGHIQDAYVKFIAMGALVVAGLISLIKSFPIIFASVRMAIQSFRRVKTAVDARTEREFPMSILLIGVGTLAVIMLLLPHLPGRFPVSLVMVLLVLLFAFFFVTVSSRFVGVIGYSMEPIGPMMFTTLMAACLLFLVVGWTKPSYQAVLLVIGTVACSAAGNAGAASQDLKTGYLLGATPWKQQLGFIIGIVLSAVIVGGIIIAIDRSIPNVEHAIGYDPPGEAEPPFPAPSANMVGMFIRALIEGKVPWGLVMVGGLLSLAIGFSRISALSFAAGMYLPASATIAIFCGALIRHFADRKEKGGEQSSSFRPGILFATGLVSIGSITGMLLGFFKRFFHDQAAWFDLGHAYFERIKPWGSYLSLLLFAGAGLLIYRQSQKR